LGARTCFPDKTGLTSAERRPAKARSPPATGALPQKIAGNAFSKHFRHFLVTLNEWVIPRKRRGKLDSDPKMNQTEWRLPVHEQPRSVVAVNQSVISWDVRQLTDETTPQPIPYPKTPRQMAVLAISTYFHFFVFIIFFLGGGHVPPTPGSPPHTPMR